MKAHLTKLSLALLSTVFLLGCQEQGSGPVGPDGPRFNKPVDGVHDHGGGGGTTEAASYEATFTGDIIGDEIQLHEGLYTGVHNLPPLNLSFFQAAPTDDGGYTAEEGAICFAGDSFFVEFSIREGKAKDPGDAKAGPLTFAALGTDGTPVIYGLDLFGTITQGKLPPDVGENLKITWGTFAIFNQGEGKHVACKGTGSLNSVVEVMNTTPTS